MAPVISSFNLDEFLSRVELHPVGEDSTEKS